MSDPLDASPSATEPVGSHGLIAATVLSIGLALLATAQIGQLPPAAATGEQVVSWFREHQEGVRWSVWMLTVAMPPTAVMFANLRRLLPVPYCDVYFLGAVGIIATGVVQTLIQAGLALHADQLEPATARTVLDIALFFGPVLTGSTVTMMAPVTVLALREGRLPRWLGLLGAIALAEQAVETITIFGQSGFTAPGGAMNLQLGAALVAGWMLAFGIWAGIRGPGVPG